MFYYYSLFFALNYYGLYNSISLRKFINLPERDYEQCVGKIVSCIHASIIVTSSFFLLLSIIEADTWINFLDITRGYCFYDTMMILYYTPQDKNMIIHHSMLFFGSFSNFVSVYPILVQMVFYHPWVLLSAWLFQCNFQQTSSSAFLLDTLQSQSPFLEIALHMDHANYVLEKE